MGADMNLNRQRPWADLPMEILSFIAIRLQLLELLSFRGTCKDFRSASTTAITKIESSSKPWLLFHKSDSKFVIYNQDESKTYNRPIPDLDGAICLASYQGWLLLFKQELIFFFSPFSLSKIPLPDFPNKQIDGHVAAFSHPPTSPNCIVSTINLSEKSWFEIYILSKGQTTWVLHKITPNPSSLGSNPSLTGATFDHKSQTFYYMYDKDDANMVMTFSVKESKWKQYKIVHSGDKDSELLPYCYSVTKFYDRFKENLHELNLEDDEYVDVCGITYELENSGPKVYLNEAVNVSPTKTRKRNAVWIQPRFSEDQTDLHW